MKIWVVQYKYRGNKWSSSTLTGWTRRQAIDAWIDILLDKEKARKEWRARVRRGDIRCVKAKIVAPKE